MEINITVDIGQGPRTIAFDPENITLGFLEDLEEAQETNRWGPLARALGTLLNFSREEQRALTMKQFRQIAAALQQSTEQINADAKKA